MPIYSVGEGYPFVMKRIWLVTFITGLLVGQGAFAQATGTTPLQNGQLFNNNSTAGSMLNALNNPMSGALKGYDQCFEGNLRLQTRIYNPLVDPAKSMADKAENLKKALEKQIKSMPKEPTACKRPEKKAEGVSVACKKAWTKYDDDVKAYKKTKEAEDEKTKESAKAELELMATFDWNTLSAKPKANETQDQANKRLDEKLSKMANEECISFGIDSFPAMSCTLLSNTKFFDRLPIMLQFESEAIACEKNRLDLLNRVTTCLDQNVSAVAQQIQNLTSKFSAQYQIHVDTLNWMKAQEDARRTAIDQQILPNIIKNGKPDGTGKMQEIRDQINAVLVSENGIWAKAASIQAELEKLDQDRQNAEAFYQADVAATAMSCFNNGTKGAVTNADLQAGKTFGLADQFADLVASTVARTEVVDGQDVLLSQARTDKDQNAARVRSTIMNRFNAIFSNVPQPAQGGSTAVPTSTGAYRSQASINAAVNAAFGEYSYLKRNSDGTVSGEKISLAAAVNNEINRCFALARGSKDVPSEPYIRRMNSLTNIDIQRKKQVATINTGLSDAYKTFVDAANVLQLPNRTPEQYGANMSECRNDQNPAGMANCFDTFRGAMNSLANGGPNMASKFDIPTTFVRRPMQMAQGLSTFGLTGAAFNDLPGVITILCSGLNDCVRQVDMKRTALENDIVNIKKDRLKYASAATQQMQTMGMQLMNQGAPQFGQQSLQQSTNDLMAKISMIQNELANYGVSAGGDIPTIPPANWTPISGDDNALAGFIERPQDPVSAVAAGAIDFRKNPFASLRKGVADAGKSLEEKRKKLGEYETKKGETKKTCDKDATDALDALSKRVSDASGCLLLTGAKLNNDVSTVDDSTYSKLSDIATYFSGGSSSPLKGKGLTECDALIDAGIEPTKPSSKPGQNDLISDSDINTGFGCNPPDPKKPNEVPGDAATWNGIKITKWRSLKTGSFDSSDPNQCEQLKAAAIKTLAACRDKLKITNMQNCSSTSSDLQKKVDEAIANNKKPTTVAPTTTTPAKVQGGH